VEATPHYVTWLRKKDAAAAMMGTAQLTDFAWNENRNAEYAEYEASARYHDCGSTRSAAQNGLDIAGDPKMVAYDAL
jgi:hypothetical protein